MKLISKPAASAIWSKLPEWQKAQKRLKQLPVGPVAAAINFYSLSTPCVNT